MSLTNFRHTAAALATAGVFTFMTAGSALAQSVAVYGPETQGRADPISMIELSVGRSLPVTTPVALTKASVASPDIADLIVVSGREFVINAKAIGETDAVLWLANGTRQHLRVSVRSPSDRQQVAVYIRFAEVNRTLLRTIGVSARYRDAQGHERIGTGTFNTDNPFNADGSITLPGTTGFLTVLTDFNTKRLLALLDANEQKGLSRTLAEPDVLAGNRDTATFLAGGEVPIPIVQGSQTAGGTNTVTIMFKEFGVKLKFVPEILNDSLIKLSLAPEVSSIDNNNAITLSGFRIPAFQTRRVSTTVDVRRDESLIISGLFNNSRNLVKTGIPFLQDIPILGQLFSSTQWQNDETELLVVVTPVVIDPMHTRPVDTLPIIPDTALPARGAIQNRLPPVAKPEPR
ncbi:MAG: pilus assembly protein N-terminal domain-containing protein [Gemmatimonadota bacterium]